MDQPSRQSGLSDQSGKSSVGGKDDDDQSMNNVPTRVAAKKARTLSSLIQDNDLQGLKERLKSAQRHEMNGVFLWACNRGKVEAVRILIQHGVDLHLTDQFGASALHHAVQGKSSGVVELLVKSGIDFSEWKVESETLLHWASRNGHVNVVTVLVHRGACLKVADGYGRYPLHSACLQGVWQVIPVLLARTSRVRPDWNPLVEEEETDFTQPARMTTASCSDVGVGPDDTDQNDWTPLHYACTSYAGNPLRVVQELIKAKANPLIPTPNGKTSLDLAFESGRDYLFLSCLAMSDILALLTKTDSIRPSQPPTEKPDYTRRLNITSAFPESEEELEERETGRRNMTRVRRHYSFLHDDFHRMSSRKTRLVKGRKMTEDLQLHEAEPHNKIKEWSLTTIWRHILQNDDVELLEILRDFRVNESESSQLEPLFNNFEDAYTMEPHILSEIHMSCFENGLAIFSFVKGHFRELLDNKGYSEIFLKLTKFNGNALSPEFVDKCTVMWPLSSSILFIALLCGRLKVVEMLLRMRQYDILPTTFVIILIVRRFAKDSAFTEQVKSSLYEFSAKLETLAVDVLNRSFLKDNSEGKYMSINFINKPMGCLGGSTIIDVAATACCETFLSLPCSQVVLYNLWHGELHWLPYSWKLVSKFCPFLLPLYFVNRQKRERRASAYSRKISSFDNSKEQFVSLHIPGRDCGSQRFKHVGCIEDLTQSTCRDRMRMIKYAFTAPANKFIFHSIFHVIFLIMFSFVLLYDFRFKVSVTEMLCYSFIFGYTIEEGRQILLQGMEKKMKAYLADTWNIFDMMAIILSIIGFVIRLQAPSTTKNDSISEEVVNYEMFAARIVLLSGLLIFYMRILFVFSLFSRLGPKLRMMFAMIWYDLLPMLCIFLLFFVSFGITFQGILYPNGYDLTKTKGGIFHQQAPQTILSNIVRTSFYGMLAAEYNVQLLESASTGDCNSTASCGTIIFVGRNLILYGFHILYVLIVNIMLVNLLIALYSNTVAHINEKSMAHWLADKYSLSHEFRQRSVCPPPLNVISIAVELILFCCRLRQKSYSTNQGSCNCKTIRFLVIQAFALRDQRFKLGQTRLQEATEMSDRLSSIEKQLSSLKALIKSSNTKRRNFKPHFENERVVVH